MRKALTAIALLIGLVVQAQDNQLAQIRKQYAEAKQSIEKRQKADLTPNDMVVNSNYMAPGAGPVNDVTHYFYSGNYEENIETYIYTPFFITHKYNVGAKSYYEEFLFDGDSLVFYFCRSDNDETRYYWGKNGFFHEIVKGDRNMDDAFAVRLAYDLKDAFDKLMNRNY